MAEKKAQKNKTKEILPKESSILVGKILFGIALLIALIAGVLQFENATINQIVGGALIVIGLAIGVVNSYKDRAIPFMISAFIIAILLQPLMQGLFEVVGIQAQELQVIINGVFINITTFIVPSALVVALKTILIDETDKKN